MQNSFFLDLSSTQISSTRLSNKSISDYFERSRILSQSRSWEGLTGVIHGFQKNGVLVNFRDRVFPNELWELRKILPGGTEQWLVLFFCIQTLNARKLPIG